MKYPNQFQEIYACGIMKTGEKLYKINVPMTPEQQSDPNFIRSHPSEDEIVIRMPESQYLKFVDNWNAYFDMVKLAEEHPEFKDQFHRLVAFASILK